jgi:hypothetical protein
VSNECTFTVAPATTALVESVTVPESVAVDCARAIDPNIVAKTAITNIRKYIAECFTARLLKETQDHAYCYASQSHFESLFLQFHAACENTPPSHGSCHRLRTSFASAQKL